MPWGDLDSLDSLMRDMDVDILICGHTHNRLVKKIYSRYIINPGSITGVSGPTREYFILR